MTKSMTTSEAKGPTSGAMLDEPLRGEVHDVIPVDASGLGVEDGHEIRIVHQPYHITSTHQWVVWGRRRKRLCALNT